MQFRERHRTVLTVPRLLSLRGFIIAGGHSRKPLRMLRRWQHAYIIQRSVQAAHHWHAGEHRFGLWKGAQ
eukprot:2703033-Pyramimonas_sp.AAC.1